MSFFPMHILGLAGIEILIGLTAIGTLVATAAFFIGSSKGQKMEEIEPDQFIDDSVDIKEKQAPPVKALSEPLPSVLSEPLPVLSEPLPPVLSEPLPPVLSDPSSPVLSDPSSPVLSDPPRPSLLMRIMGWQGIPLKWRVLLYIVYNGAIIIGYKLNLAELVQYNGPFALFEFLKFMVKRQTGIDYEELKAKTGREPQFNHWTGKWEA